jgi:hypothetical protein
LFAGEVPVHGRSADARGGAEVFDRDPVEASLGEEGGCGPEQGGAPVCFGLAALRGPGVGRTLRLRLRDFGHRLPSLLDISVNEH